jgi:HD superfamily phosphohydrolase
MRSWVGFYHNNPYKQNLFYLPMGFDNFLYGACDEFSPVVSELIKGPSLQRLKEIDQAGYRPLWVNPEVDDMGEHNRFAHSLGVFLLLKRYRAPLEEQIAGLIHDVSHSVFSHCIDYALDEGSEKEHDYQDNVFEDFVRASEIPGILEKHGLDTDYILDESNFTPLHLHRDFLYAFYGSLFSHSFFPLSF